LLVRCTSEATALNAERAEAAENGYDAGVAVQLRCPLSSSAFFAFSALEEAVFRRGRARPARRPVTIR